LIYNNNIDQDMLEELGTPKAANKTCDINNSIEMFHISVVQFSLSLHNNNNFVGMMS